MHACYQQRQLLLERAAEAGLPADSIRSLTQALATEKTQAFQGPRQEASHRSQLLRHQSLSQWVLMQRTVLHLSQMLEIIATGGRLQPTYGKDGSAPTSGSLMDQAV